MSSTYNGNSATFYPSLTLMTGADKPTAQVFRTPLERLLDNAMYLRDREDALFLRQATSLRGKNATFTDTADRLAATSMLGVEDCPGPAIAVKAGEAFAVYDQDGTEAQGGAVPNLTTVKDAAVNTAGRIVVVGATTPFCAFRILGGSWTAGGAQIGGEANDVVYSPAYNGFLASRGANVCRSTDATSWASVATGLTDTLRVAVIGGGAGAGRVIVQSTDATPTFALSTNNGASYAVQAGTVPFAAQAFGPGFISGCPVVTKNNLNRYVYHVGMYDSGARIRLARTADGVTWEAGPTIETPPGATFDTGPFFRICKSTGLMVIVCISIVPAVQDLALLYVSQDFTRWVGPASHPVSLGAAYAIASGRLLRSIGEDLEASDGIGHKVFSL